MDRSNVAEPTGLDRMDRQEARLSSRMSEGVLFEIEAWTAMSDQAFTHPTTQVPPSRSPSDDEDHAEGDKSGGDKAKGDKAGGGIEHNQAESSAAQQRSAKSVVGVFDPLRRLTCVTECLAKEVPWLVVLCAFALILGSRQLCEVANAQLSPKQTFSVSRNGSSIPKNFPAKVGHVASASIAFAAQARCVSQASFVTAVPAPTAGSTDLWKVYRPIDDAEFPVGTRLISIIGSKPFGSAAIVRVEDPYGNSIQFVVPAIRPFFSITLDKSGEMLPTGDWEITLVDALESNVAKDQVRFRIKDGESTDPLPTIETPREGETYPENIPYILFAGVTGTGSKVWLRVVDMATEEHILITEVDAAAHNVWAYVYSWTLGEGDWQAQVYSADPHLGGYPTDWTNFTTVDYSIENWDLLWHWEWQ